VAFEHRREPRGVAADLAPNRQAVDRRRPAARQVRDVRDEHGLDALAGRESGPLER
jgi:hypothetical protein